MGLLSTNTPLRPLGSCLLKKAVVSQALPVFQRAEKVVTDQGSEGTKQREIG